MSWTQWFIFLLIIQIIHGLGTWKLYVKAGRKSWEAAIPIYNAMVLMQIIKRPKWWVFLLFIPIIYSIASSVVSGSSHHRTRMIEGGHHSTGRGTNMKW